MAFIHEFSKEKNTKARDMFQRAIELDPNYSDAYSGLARSYHRDLLMQCTDDRKESIAKALEAARRAVTLDRVSSIAHQVLSTAHIWRNEHDLALAEARVTVELNPNDAIGLHGLGNKSDLAGDPEGIPRMLRAQQLNPQDPDRHVHLTFLARAYVNIQEHEKAIECTRIAIQQRPDYPHAYFILAIALGHIGRIKEARTTLNECERLQAGFVDSRANWCPYTNDGSNQYLLAGLEKAKGSR
jgi:adenylate cyclase